MVSTESSTADNVGAYFEENDLGTVGKDIFVNHAPENRIDFFLITDTTGLNPTQDYPIDHPAVQVAYYGRAASHAESYTKIMYAYKLLNRKQNITVGVKDMMYCQAMARPQNIGLDKEKNRWLWTFNVVFKERITDEE